jgi:hypothetical protein
MADAFISYAREDQATAIRLYNDLKRAGITPWLDHEDLLPGQNWEHEIRRAIRESRYFLALLSSHSLSKVGFVQSELKAGLRVLDEFPPDKAFLIPIRLEDCSPSDDRLRALNWLNLFPSYEEGLQKLIKLIQLDANSAIKGIPTLESEKRDLYSQFLALTMSVYEAAMKRAVMLSDRNPFAQRLAAQANEDLERDGKTIFNLIQRMEIVSSNKVRELGRAIAGRSVTWKMLVYLPDAKAKLEQSFGEFIATERPSFIAATREELGLS